MVVKWPNLVLSACKCCYPNNRAPRSVLLSIKSRKQQEMEKKKKKQEKTTLILFLFFQDRLKLSKFKSMLINCNGQLVAFFLLGYIFLVVYSTEFK